MTYCSGFIHGPCPPGWQGFDGGKCFKYYSSKKTWTEALRSCQQCSSNPTSTLASVPDSATNDFIVSMISGFVWIGGHLNSAKRWVWSDGTRWSYQNWFTHEPNNHHGNEEYLELYYQPSSGLHRKWNDQDNNHKFGYVCQLCKDLFWFCLIKKYLLLHFRQWPTGIFNWGQKQ